MERVSTGIHELDRILQGGFPQGSTILVVSRPGAGKTTLAEPQVKVLRFQQEFDYFDKKKFQKSVIYKDLGSTLRTEGPQSVLNLLDEFLKEYEPSMVAIDTIKTVSDMMPSLIEFRKFILDMSLRMAVWGCTVLLLGEYSEDEIEMRPESAIVDGIIYLSGVEEEIFQKRFLRIIKMRGTDYISGENVFRITQRGIELFPRLKPVVGAQRYCQYTERVSTGILGLDEMMSGGLLRSTTTMVCGQTGTGKTLFALQYTDSALKNGENVLYISYEENPEQLIANAKGLGINLEPYIDDCRL